MFATAVVKTPKEVTQKRKQGQLHYLLIFSFIEMPDFFIPWVFQNDPNKTVCQETFDYVQLTPSV